MVTPADVAWKILPAASTFQAELVETYGQPWLDAQIPAMREYLCRYFRGDRGCAASIGKSLRPVGGTDDGGKLLKLRWTYPGSGKSGGLRVLVACFCDDRVVEIRNIDYRRNDPELA